MKKLILLLSLFLSCQSSWAQNILMFVAHEDTYYSEYIVMRRALETAGYTVDVRSSSADSVSIYMIPNGTDIVATANTLGGSNYTQFTQQFQGLFGSTWDANWNTTPAYAHINGRIQDVLDMSTYEALVVVGGTGAIEYRVDGSYNSHGTGNRLVPATEVQAAAERLNALAVQALHAGKPVMAQCHGASIPVFWRIPNTSGAGQEAMGFSLLKGGEATGFPEPATAPTLTGLDVTHRNLDRLIISSPHTTLNDGGKGDYKIITTRDWYPQTVAHAARTLLNIIETHPTKQEQERTVDVLILHGGAIDPNNCSASNRANDVPCNYGTGLNLPADYTDLAALLSGNSPNDSFNIVVSDVNITGTNLPFLPNDETSILSHLLQYDVIVFFKHWSTGVTNELQNAIVSYADAGGGVLGLHHGLYNDIDGGVRNKDILVNQLFGVESAMNTWSANLTNYNMVATNHGHFVSTYGISWANPLQAPASWGANPLPTIANSNYAYYPSFPIYDELYNNMAFAAGQTFGRAVGQITPLFSNDQNPAGQVHTNGFVKLFNPSADNSVGRVAFFQASERRESLDLNHAFGQVVRNAVIWVGWNDLNNIALPVELTTMEHDCNKGFALLKWETASEKNNAYFTIERSQNGLVWQEAGVVEAKGNTNLLQQYSFRDDRLFKDYAYYRVYQTDLDGSKHYFPIISMDCDQTNFNQPYLFPNPARENVELRLNRDLVRTMTIEVLNTNGQIIWNQKVENTNHIQLPILNWERGLYFVKVISEELNTTVLKFIKQ